MINVRKRENYYQYSFEAARIGGKRKQITKSVFNTKAEAEKAGVIAYNKYMQTGRSFKPEDISYSDYLDYWMKEYCEVNLKYHTIEVYKRIIRIHIKPFIGHYLLPQITTATLQEFINEQGNNFYYLKCDIHKYFPSINHEVLLNKLKRIGLTTDELYMARLFMTNYETSVGIPLGNLSSQWCALIYLDDLDRFIKEKLQIKGYIRYMDDFILIHKDKNYLRYCLKEIDNFCKERLKVELNAKTQIGKVKNGIDFLGFRHTLSDSGKVIRKLRLSAKKRLRKHLKTMKKLRIKGIIDDEYVSTRKNAFYAHIMYSDEKYFQKQCMINE